MGDHGQRYAGRVTSIGPYRAGEVLGSVSSRTGFLLSVLGDGFQRRIREVLAAHDLKPRQLRILDLLGEHGPVGQRELAELMSVDQSVLVGLLNPRDTARLVKRQRDANDRRRHVVTITAAGRRRLAKADQEFREAEDAFFGELTADEREQLHRMLSRLREASDPSPDPDC